MTRNLLMFFTALVFVSFQADDPQWKTIQQAMEQGNASQLSSFFGSTITLSIPGYQGNYSNKQARLIMQGFFKQYPPRSFHLKTSGNTSGTSKYYLCNYETTTGQHYAVCLMLKYDQKQPAIIQLTFDKGS